MKEVVRALNVLSRHGSTAQFPVLIGDDQAQIAQASFLASKQDLVLKKQELKQLAVFFKQLHKQRKVCLKANKRKSLKKACRHRGEFSTEKERFEFQDKVKKHRGEKALKHAEKAKRKEEKATKKAQKHALKANVQEESSKHPEIPACLIRHSEKAKKYEQKASKQAEKAKKCEAKVARKAQKHEEKAARKAEKEKRHGQCEGFGAQVPCVDQAQ